MLKETPRPWPSHSAAVPSATGPPICPTEIPTSISSDSAAAIHWMHFSRWHRRRDRGTSVPSIGAAPRHLPSTPTRPRRKRSRTLCRNTAGSRCSTSVPHAFLHLQIGEPVRSTRPARGPTHSTGDWAPRSPRRRQSQREPCARMT